MKIFFVLFIFIFSLILVDSSDSKNNPEATTDNQQVAIVYSGNNNETIIVAANTTTEEQQRKDDAEMLILCARTLAVVEENYFNYSDGNYSADYQELRNYSNNHIKECDNYIISPIELTFNEKTAIPGYKYTVTSKKDKLLEVTHDDLISNCSNYYGCSIITNDYLEKALSN
jgi:hypothetical protein